MTPKNIATHYACALFQSMLSQPESLPQIDQLAWLLDLSQAYPELDRFLRHPFIKNQEKKRVLSRIGGHQLNQTVLNFLFLLIDKKRIQYVSDIVQRYLELVHQRLGLIHTDVVTAWPLEEDTREALKRQLNVAYGTGIRLRERIDPRIIGGMILFMGHHMLDNSMRSRLIKLKKDLLN